MIVLDVVIAVVIFLVIIQVGVRMIRFVGHPAPPPPPPAGELRKINAKFRCAVCGIEMRVLLSPDEDPEPPRHCMEEMDLLPARE